jgi:hypothetical protein
MYKDDPNYEKWFNDYISQKEVYPYAFTDYEGAMVSFWHLEENRPFLTIAVDSLFVYEDGCIEVYSGDYTGAVATIWHWGFWQIVT